MDYKISDEYDGKTRKLFKAECQFCSKEYWVPGHILKKSKCCSKECYLSLRQKIGKKIDINCSLCDSSFKRWKHHLAKDSSRSHYCSRKCQIEASRRHKGKCIGCSVQLTGKQKKYCSQSCSFDFKFKTKIKEWKDGKLSGMCLSESVSSWLRKYILNKFDNKCSICGWCEINKTTNNIPVQIDPIDRNYKNNSEDNLRLLCPNCHSLTPTYGALNIGNGREKRRLKLREVQKINKSIN